jgi:hypothetical protein
MSEKIFAASNSGDAAPEESILKYGTYGNYAGFQRVRALRNFVAHENYGKFPGLPRGQI